MGSGASTNRVGDVSPSVAADGQAENPTTPANGPDAGTSADQEEQGITTRQAQILGYPPPKSPTTEKIDIFEVEHYFEIDKKSRKKLPEKVLFGSYKELVDHLTKDLTTELQRLRALFIWLSSQNISSLEKQLPNLPEQGTPCDYLLKISWKMGNHAHMFAHLARAAGFQCMVITGINKSAAYQLGQPMDEELKKSMAAQWNAVVINGQWRLLDVFWSSTVLVGKKDNDWTLLSDETTQTENAEEDGGRSFHAINDFFFIPDPDKFVSTHFPDDPAWQLLVNPISEEEFESMPYIRDRFYDLKLKLDGNNSKNLLNTKKGRICIKFGLNPNLTKACQFRYLMFRNRQEKDKITKTAFEKFVYYVKTDQELTFSATFPVVGLFKMDIFGQNKNVHDSMDLLCSYLIECKDPEHDVQPLPILPEIGWGPGTEAEEKGIKAKSHHSGTITTTDGYVDMRFELTRRLSVLQSLKSNYLEDWLLKRFAIILTENDELVIKVRVLTPGEYALEMFADEEDEKGQLPNICNYLVKCPKLTKKPQPFPKLYDGILGKSKIAEKWGIRSITHPGDFYKIQEHISQFKFECTKPDIEIFCELDHTKMSNEQLCQAVTRATRGMQTGFKIEFPKSGEYGLNVFARKKGRVDIRHIHSYLLETTQSEDTKNEKKSPPRIVPITTNQPTVDIDIPTADSDLKAELSRKNAKMVYDLKFSHDGQKMVFNVTLPEDGEGEYKLDVYEGGATNGLKHFIEFHIVYDKSYREPVKEGDNEVSEEEKECIRQEKALAAKHKLHLVKLKTAIASNDVGVIQAAIQDFVQSETPDPEDNIKKAKNIIMVLKLTKVLSSVISKRDRKKLEDTVTMVEKKGFGRQFKLQLSMANRIIDQLLRLENMQHDIMTLNHRTIAEIKSYDAPPAVVHTVMTATFLLLGEREKRLKKWKNCIALIRKTGKENFKERVQSMKINSLPMQVAMRAKEILKKINLMDVRAVSSGAATFFKWSAGMIEELESIYTQNGGDLDMVKK